MPKPDFDKLARDLRRAGVAERHVRRAEIELRDHFDDLVDEAIGNGLERRQAQSLAAETLGDLDAVGAIIGTQPELRHWAFRWPRAALVLYSLACVAALPAAPVIAGVQNAPLLARWAACLLLGGLVTASMLLVLQLSITLT